MNLLINLSALLLAVTFHEWGHYIAARLAGAPVRGFNVGIGPKVISGRDRRGTVFALRWLPIGGYVEFDPDGFKTVSPLRKFLIAAAGPFVNFLIVVAIASLIGMLGAVLSVFGVMYVATLTGLLKLLILPVTALVDWLGGDTVVAEAARASGAAAREFHGPIGLATMKHQTDMPWWFDFGWWFFLFNLGLMMFNLLPIPVLDGGRMIFAAMEGAIGRARTERIEGAAMLIGGLLLLYIFVLITVLDVRNLF